MFVCEFWVQIVLKSVYQSIPKTLIQPCNCTEALLLGYLRIERKFDIKRVLPGRLFDY